MSEEVIEQPVVVEEKTVINPFDENNWKSEPIVIENIETKKVEEKQKIEEQEEEVFDENTFVKNYFGYDSVELAKKDIQELRDAKGRQPEPLKFANEASEKYFNALKDGKEDDIYNYLREKKNLERIEKMDIKTINEASEIIKADLQYKYKDLTPEEIDRQFSRRFTIPKEPKQSDTQTDDEFAETMADYKQKVKDVEMDMIIEAKMARPELSKFKSELVLPDIPKPTNPNQLSQEELAQREADNKAFQEIFNRDYKNFNGYSISVKTEDGELPIKYTVTPEEVESQKREFDNFNLEKFFAKRWFSVDEKENKVSPNVQATLDDIYLLQNRDKIFQKIANEAAAQTAVLLRKQKSNIKINEGGAKVMKIDKPKEAVENQVEHLWNNA